MTSPPSPSGSDDDCKPWWKRHSKEIITGIFAILAAAIAALVGVVIAKALEDSPEKAKPSASESAPALITASPTLTVSDSPSPSPTPSETVATEEPTALPPVVDDGEAEETTPPSPTVQYLTQDGPIGGYGNWRKSGSARLSDGFYDQSVIFSPGVHSNYVLSLSFNVPSGLSKFEAKVGLDTDTMPDYVAQVKIMDRNKSIIKTLTLQSGQTYEVNEDISNTNLVTISASVVRWSDDAIGNRPRIVVGDGRFTQ